MKQCSMCKQEKDESEFNKNIKMLDGLNYYCRSCISITSKKYREKNKEIVKKCNRERNKKWRNNNPETYKAAKRKTYYNITQENFKKLLKNQNNCCAICGKEFDKTPYVDHDHKTNKIRGLLCQKCNSGLGMLGDNLENLKRAVDYLSKDHGDLYVR